jgi:hypothetical protein
MRHIQGPKQIFTGSEISHRQPSTKEMEHSAKLHHLSLALLYDASRHFAKNCLASPCIEDLLIFYVLVLAEVIILALLHLHGIAQRLPLPSMLPQRVYLRDQELLSVLNKGADFASHL